MWDGSRTAHCYKVGPMTEVWWLPLTTSASLVNPSAHGDSAHLKILRYCPAASIALRHLWCI